MLPRDWISLVGLLTVLGGSVFYLGALSGRIETLEAIVSRTVNDAEEAAQDRIDAFSSDLGSLVMAPVEWERTTPPTTLLGSDLGICFITGIRGNFGGPDETVTVEIREGDWVLSGDADNDSAGVTARCWRFPH